MCLYPQFLFYIVVLNPNFSVVCEPRKFGTDPIPMFEVFMNYGYFVLKLNHFFDTVFFILRKKWSQITFLHVYHHVLTSLAAYVGLLYLPGWFKSAEVPDNFHFLFICAAISIRVPLSSQSDLTQFCIINFRWSWHHLWIYKLLRKCHHVYVLFPIHL